MYNLEKLLFDFALDTESDERNYDLAIAYDKLGQTASAVSYYLRAAERTSNNDLAYECLIRAGHCFNKQGNRDSTVKVLYKRAIDLIPNRPEAYLCLARYFEWNKNYSDCYSYSNLALNNCDLTLPSLRTNVHDPIIYTDYGLLFEKAISAWWIGRSQESRDILRYLAKQYSRKIDDQHFSSIQDNLSRIGVGPISQSTVPYTSTMSGDLRFKFKNHELVKTNHSQVMQDMFILSALDGKQNGTYLEIGSSHPYFNNNTALLETVFNWKGVGIEYKQEHVDEYRKHRSNKVLLANALEVDYNEILQDISINGSVDYLQLDCEPSSVTYEIMTKIPFDKYKFAVITYEHDDYIDIFNKYKAKSRAFLISRGYELIVSDVSPDGKSNFEDWWVHPDLVSRDIINILKNNGSEIKQVREYFTSKDVVEDDLTFNFTINHRPEKRLFIVENFYNDPMSVRRFALAQDYHQGGVGRGYIGNRTFKQFLFPGLKEKFEEIMGIKISRWEEHGMNGRFQVARAGDPLVYHCDAQKWAGMLYLTPNAPFETGTTMWAHKKTRIHHSSHPEIMATFRKESTFDKTPYEPVDVAGNVFNRLVIFDAGCIHSASEYFGFDDDNCRLWQMFFFD